MNELALFAGAGGGILGGHLLGWRTVCAVEWDAYAASVLVQRQNDGTLPAFPIWDDVQTFDGREWRGRVDVISGGFPCQDISCAGKGAGIDGDRSGMWGHMARIVSEVRPQYVFVENSPMLVGRGLTRVLGDLAQMGYDAKWGIVGAHHVAAPHKRDRIWLVANSKKLQRDGSNHNAGVGMESEQVPKSGNNCGKVNVANTRSERGQLSVERKLSAIEQYRSDGEARSLSGIAGEWWATEPDVGRVAHGVANRVDRLKAIGNGQVPQAAALAWKILTGDRLNSCENT
jgi:DNA (cytosine-5)-methyltransferase 1